MKRFICLVLAFVIFFGICGIIAPDINNIYKLKEADSFAEQVNVLVKQYESRQDTQNRLIVNSNKIKESYGAVKVIKAHGFQVMQFKDYESAESAKSSIEKLGVACDRDDFAYTQAIKKAPSTKDLWASQITQSDVTMNYLATTGKTYNDVTVAVMDTGINDAHKSFDGRLIECNKNFSSSGSMNSSSDDSGHGTSVAGVIALNTLDNVKIKPYKTFDKEGKCTNSQIVATLNYILNEKKLPDIINMSFSVQSISSSVTRDSLTRNLISKGVTIITSAGNNAVNAKFYYPANIGEVITVSSSNKKNERAEFSNYGKCVDIAAPGVGVYTCELDGTYSYENGTSFSAPFVSAAAATVLMQKSGLDCNKIKKTICDEAVPVYIKNYQVEWCGAGIVNFSGLIYGEKAIAPSFGTPQGKYNEPFKLEIKAANNEKIMYTTDNTVPSSNNGFEYTKPIESAIDFIREVKAKGLKTGIVTSDAKESTLLTLKHFQWENLFDVVIGRESTKETKESGAPVKLALELLKSNPENTLMVGDAPMDFIAAKNGGVNQTILVSTGQIDENTLMQTSEFTTTSLDNIEIY